MSKLYIMCGLAFSGKSTLARQIAEYTKSQLVAFDKLWVEKDKEKPITKDAEGWKFIRYVAQDEILKKLHDGVSVVYDDNNIKFEHREELREIAKQAGVDAMVIYLDTPIEIIRKREEQNKISLSRHEVEPANFQTVLEQLEVPSLAENVVLFKPETNVKVWLDDLEKKLH